MRIIRKRKGKNLLQLLISIIVPVYNRKKYLDDCIKSLLNQTYSHIEILLIDDGSVDSSPEICKQYASLDKRVRYIPIKHAGVSAARNKGLDEAKGEYIMFCDSDDMVKANWVSSFVAEIREDTILVMSGYEVLETGMKVLTEDKERSIDISQFLEYRGKWGLYCVWMCCIKRSNVRFMTGVSYGEDALYLMNYIDSMKSGSLIYISDTLYRHRQNTNLSLTIYGRRGKKSYDATVACLERIKNRWGCSETVWKRTMNYVVNAWFSEEVEEASYGNLRKLMNDERWEYYVGHLYGGLCEKAARSHCPLLVWIYFRLKRLSWRLKEIFLK